MVEIPFYHIFRIIEKMKSGQDISNDDIARLVGDPGYHMMKLFDPNLRTEVFSRGPNTYNRRYAQIRYETPYQTYPKRFGSGRGRRRYKKYTFSKRRYRR